MDFKNQERSIYLSIYSFQNIYLFFSDYIFLIYTYLSKSKLIYLQHNLNFQGLFTFI